MKQAKHEKRSAKLRNSERIARLVGIEYNTTMHPYGGYFDSYQCEQIANKLEAQARKIELLQAKAKAQGELLTHIDDTPTEAKP